MEDFATVMKMMGSLPEDTQAHILKTLASPAEANKLLRENGIDAEAFGRPRTNEEILKNHERKLQQMRNTSRQKAVMSFSLPTSQTKPTMEPQPPGNLLPIHVKSLHSGTTHRGRVLRGELVVLPIPMTSIQTVLQDEMLDVIPVSLYNVGHNEAMCMRMLRKGAKILIQEPYFKLMRDGHHGVRVDDFNDVIFVDRLGPCSGDNSQDWRDEGKKHFGVHQFPEAARCFQEALARCDPDVVAVLNNASAAFGNVEEHWKSLFCAVAATRVAPSSAKARYRVAEALEGLHYFALARHYCEEAYGLGGGPDCKDMQKRLRKTYGHEVLSVIASPDEEIVVLLAENTKALMSFESVDAPRDNQSVAELKKKGNALYGVGDYQGALKHYMMALDTEEANRVSTLLANISACYLGQKNAAPKAALEANATLVINRSFEKAHYRRGKAIWKMNKQHLALEALKHAPEFDSLDQLSRRIRQSLRDDNTPVPQHRQGISELEAHTFMDAERDVMPTDAVAMMNNFLQMFSSTQQSTSKSLGIGAIDDRVVAFHEQFARMGHWPLQCNVPACKEILRDAYEHARSKMMGLALLDDRFAGMFEMGFKSHYNIMKRCGGKTKLQAWLAHAKHGSVIFPLRNEYSRQIAHSFSNQPRTPIPVSPGSTHVSVGFVDLGELLFTEIPSDGCIRWVGYEASEYSIAKCLVLRQMLRSSAPATDIVQVWFSSTWARQAESAFHQALCTVLAQEHPDDLVKRVLLHWRKYSVDAVPLPDARRQWLERHPDCPTAIASLCKREDRDSMCHYLLSGDLTDSPRVGSVLMFAMPQGVGHLSLSESVFEMLPTEMVFKYHHTNQCPNIVTAAVEMLTERVAIFVGTNSENGSVTAQYSWAGEIPQGPTFNPAKSGSPDQAKSHSQKAERSYVDVVRGNRSTHSIELIN